MRRDTFLKYIAALAAGGAAAAFPLSALAAANVKMMIPANPGGGWDTTGRALGKAMQDSGAASTVTYENKGGAAGALGLAQFVNGAKGDGNAIMVMGAVTLGTIDKLGHTQRARSASLVFKRHGTGRTGILHGFAQGAARGVPTAARVGRDHHFDVGSS